eukprot:CAMPEP_0170485600 /NCGR_PEP_ID=MMETSP0208-20121228/4835_1 /TAXON_ID=197538 /ORGANISM="Strombidium inclinatum, Strain S3" /LENGTH=47 /DNA_ID= /DNA_START= /DNA_END= /DNA_ORIENTATION=
MDGRSPSGFSTARYIVNRPQPITFANPTPASEVTSLSDLVDKSTSLD